MHGIYSLSLSLTHSHSHTLTSHISQAKSHLSYLICIHDLSTCLPSSMRNGCHYHNRTHCCPPGICCCGAPPGSHITTRPYHAHTLACTMLTTVLQYRGSMDAPMPPWPKCADSVRRPTTSTSNPSHKSLMASVADAKRAVIEAQLPPKGGWGEGDLKQSKRISQLLCFRATLQKQPTF